MEINQLSPARVAERFSGPRPRLHHIAWAVPPSSVEQVREALETHGAPGYLQANLDDINLSFHDSSASLGHDVEIHADVEGCKIESSVARVGEILTPSKQGRGHVEVTRAESRTSNSNVAIRRPPEASCHGLRGAP